MSGAETVLIVDDDEIALLLLKSSFELAGLNVITSTRSSETLMLYNKHKPVAIVLDIFMPDQDGIEIIKELRAQQVDASIIAVSSHEEYLKIIKQLGADQAFSKHESIQNIVKAVINR